MFFSLKRNEMNQTFHPMQYLDKALNSLRDLGLVPETTEEAPIVALIEKISQLDEARIVAIARTRIRHPCSAKWCEQVMEMKVGERYEDITNEFNSIQDDAKAMVDQLTDGKIDTWSVFRMSGSKVSRAISPAASTRSRRSTWRLARDSNDQIQREHLILEAYRDFRGAMKHSKCWRWRFSSWPKKLEEAKTLLNGAMEVLEKAADADPAERAQARIGARRTAAPVAARRAALSDCEGSWGQSYRQLQHL